MICTSYNKRHPNKILLNTKEIKHKIRNKDKNKNLCLINTHAPVLTVVNNLTLESEVANLYGRKPIMCRNL
jgi:hypothetical protein